jgi:hypothetical protein
MHTVMSLVLVMSGELVQRTSDVVGSASVGVPVGVNAIGRSMGSLVITISFIIRIIAIAPPTITGRVTIYLANLAAYINKGSRCMVWARLAPSITAPGLITAPIITAWLITARLITAPIITAWLITTPVIAAPVIVAPVITAPIITTPVITTRLIAAPVIIITVIMCRNRTTAGATAEIG